MAKKKVIVEGQIILDDKGTLKQTAKGAHSVDRRLKGAARTSSSATKNFSKMSQGITGGLVPAYATLAANIFAIGAAFRFLTDAANYRILIEGQREYATVTGESLKLLTDRLQAATGQQLAFAEAAQSVAIARAAGVTAEQIGRLGTLAKNASIALGRDLTDSLNRLIRGATKAEPELLDELGIILRLETATRNYAAEIGKTRDQLNIFEKTQAVVNEVLRQGEEKFGSFKTELNSFALLAKSFDDLINRIKHSLSGFAEFIAKALTKNVTALAGAFALMGSGIARGLMPQMPGLPSQEKAGKMAGNIFTSKTGAGARFQAGTQTKADISHFQRSMNAKKSTVLNFEQFSRREAYKTLKILQIYQMEQEASTKAIHHKMWASFKGSLLLMQAEYGKFVGVVKWLGMGLTKALSFVGWLGMLASIVGMIRQYTDGLRPEKIQAFEAAQDKVNDVLKNQNEEITKLVNNLQLADNMLSRISQTAKLFSNFDFSEVAAGFGGAAMGSIDTGDAGFWTRAGKNIAFSMAAQAGDFGSMKNIEEEGKAPMLSLKQVELLTKTRDLLKLQQSQLEPNTELWGNITDRIADFDKHLSFAGKAISGTDFEAMRQDLISLGQDGTVATKVITDFALTAGLLQSAAKEYTSALGGMIQSSTSLGQISGAMRTTGGVFSDIAAGGDSLKQFKNIKEAADKLLDASSVELLKAFLGEKTFNALYEEGGDFEANFDRLGAAITKRANDVHTFEMELLKEKSQLQANTIELTRRQPKIIAAQINKEQKVKSIKLEIEQVEKVRNMNLELGAKLTDAEIEKQNARLLVLREQLITAKEASSFAGQAYQTFVDTLGSSLSTALNDFATGAKNMKEAFLDMTQSILKAMVQILAQQAAIRALGFMGFPVGREGGIFQSPGYKSFAGGGVATGSQSGYLAKLHGTEAVVPLGNDKAIPVEFKGGGGSVSNVTVNVAAGGQQQTTTAKAGERERKLGQMIAAAVQGEILDQQRPGGILSPYGDGGG